MKSLAAIAATLALAGCIENPGPDENLNQRFNVAVLGMHWPYAGAEVRLQRKEGRIWVEARSTDASSMDSVEFAVRGGVTPYSGSNFVENGEGAFNFHGIQTVSTGWTGPIGSDIDRMPKRMHDHHFQLWVLRTWSKGNSTSNPFAGKYLGTWTYADSTGKRDSSGLMLLIDNLGRVYASLAPSGNSLGNGIFTGVFDNSQAHFAWKGSWGDFPAFLLDTLSEGTKLSGDSLRMTFNKQMPAERAALEFRCLRAHPSIPIYAGRP